MSMGMVNKDTAATIPAAGNTGDKVGNLAALHTTVKSDIVAAVNEVKDEMPDKTDNDAVAPEFNDTTEYSTGELVYKDGQLYKFDSDHAAGAWDASEVSPTTVAAEFNQLKNTITNVGNMRMTKLWENPDATQAITTGTDINVNTAGYDLIMIVGQYSTAYPQYRNAFITPQGFNASITFLSSTGDASIMRNLEYVSDNIYRCMQGYRRETASIAYDIGAIPTAIYGIKLT